MPQFREQVVKRAQYVLQSETVDRRNFVVELFTAETSLPKPGIYFVGGRVGVRDAGYPSRSISDGFNTVQEFGNDCAGFATARTGHEAYVPWFSNCSTLLIG
jgi:hypothetical protein